MLEQIRTSVENTVGDILGSVPDAMVIVDEDGRVVFTNELAERLFGYGPGELIGGMIETLVPDRFRGRHAEHRMGYFHDPRTRPMGVGLELYGRRKDGTEFPVEISLSPLKTERGTLALSAVRDVSERRAAEERAQLLIREQAARAALEDAVRMRDEFISIAAHELKTPITSLRGFAQLILGEIRKTGGASAERLSHALTRIDSQSAKLSALVEQLLDVSRMQSGRLRLERAPVDLVSLAREVASSTTARAIEVRAPSDLIVAVDPLRIEQVLMNLVDNALAYTGPEAHVAIELADSDGQVVLTVADAGPGVAPGHRERIFDPFYRADPAGSTPGLGLGLHVSRQIVEQHGGTLHAEFPPAGGTRMVVTLPKDVGSIAGTGGQG